MSTSRFAVAWSSWPYACVGCGTTKGLRQETYSINEKSVTREKQFSLLPGMQKIKITRHSMNIQLQLYLCDRCREMGQLERKGRHRANVVAMYSTLLLALILPILFSLSFTSYESLQMIQIYFMLLIPLVWIPLIFHSMAGKFEKREDTESYFEYSVVVEQKILRLGLRNEAFYNILTKSNPAFASSIRLKPGIIINSKKTLTYYGVRCFGIVCFGTVIIGILLDMFPRIERFLVLLTFPAFYVLIIGLIVRFVVYRMRNEN